MLTKASTLLDDLIKTTLTKLFLEISNPHDSSWVTKDNECLRYSDKRHYRAKVSACAQQSIFFQWITEKTQQKFGLSCLLLISPFEATC